MWPATVKILQIFSHNSVLIHHLTLTQKYAKDPELQLTAIDNKAKDWSSSGPVPSKKDLGQIQDTWLAFQLVKKVCHRIYRYIIDIKLYGAIPEKFPTE